MPPPCRSDYLEATSEEKASKRVATLYIYLATIIGGKIPTWIHKASEDCYGNSPRLEDLTKKLCAMCKLVTKGGRSEEYIYNAHDKTARDLANWWEEHQRIDAENKKRKIEKRKEKLLRKKALSKLTTEEMKALGIKNA